MNDFLKTLAPMLGTAIAGPLGGVAASFIADKLGVQERTVEAVSDALNSGKLSAEQVGQIKLAEIEFQKFLKQNQITLEQLSFGDTKSARDMQIANKAVTPAILTWIIVTLTLSAEIGMLFHVIPPGANEMVMGRVLGTLDSALVLVLGFWFGSSHGSQNKDAMIANASSPK